jgi:hypothetical protein
MGSVAHDLFFPLQDLDSSLRNPDWARGNGLPEPSWLNEVNVCETLTFIDLDFLDSAKDLQSLLDKRFRDALGRVGMF